MDPLPAADNNNNNNNNNKSVNNTETVTATSAPSSSQGKGQLQPKDAVRDTLSVGVAFYNEEPEEIRTFQWKNIFF